MVTGAIAMQMSSEAKFKLYPEKLMPLLAASANDKKLEGYSKNQFGMDAKFGSGMLDVKKFLDEQNQCDAFWIDKTGNINISNHHFIPDSSDIGKTLKICLYWMSTDSFAWWMYQDGETPNSKPSRLLPL